MADSRRNGLTGKQQRYLRALAHHLQPVVQVGKAGLTGNLIAQVDEQLDAHELIKLSVSDKSLMSRDEVGQLIAEETGAALVQTIGKLVVLYRRSPKKPKIELPQP
ncbi:MAG: ribosome assembly RNA-binding protein YhbY [Alicyclobacillus sp.]|nr:ribosome assembly RNA-binding protein YhbY [Alicyclobacillus sp.]